MPALHPLRVLIVEDEGLIAMDLEDTISDEGHAVVGWEMSADDAIRRFQETSPDLILLDIELLNGTSGLDVARHFRETGGIHFVFLTANPQVLDKDFFGAIGVMSKPFTPAKLVESLRYLQEGVCDPPPSLAQPGDLTLGPDYAAVWH